MNSEKLQNLLLNTIDKKGISQRELARLSGISRSTLNDIVNGKIKKIKLDNLYQISNILELNLENLLEACGYNSVLKSLSTDRYAGMSDRQLKEKLDEYQQSELSLLDWDDDKRKHCREAGAILFRITEKTENSIRYDDVECSKEEIVEELKKVMEELKLVQIKYDYSKLPKKSQR